MAYDEGFFLLVNQAWIKVSKATYVAAERAAGFLGEKPDEPATAAFLGLDGSCGTTLKPREGKKR